MTARPAPDGPAAEGLGAALAAHRLEASGRCSCGENIGWRNQPWVPAHERHVAAALAARLAAVPDPSETGLAAAVKRIAAVLELEADDALPSYLVPLAATKRGLAARLRTVLAEQGQA